MDYKRALDALQDWAETSENVRGLVLTGSAGAGEAHVLSDRDIEVYARDVTALVTDESWWDHLGTVLVAERLKNGDGDSTRLVYYVGGKLDFTLRPSQHMQGGTYDRPFEVMLDKDGHAGSLLLTASTWRRPTEDEFVLSINWAYAAALMCAKAAVRDELWSAKLRDQDLKSELLRMIEWDHKCRHGPDYDTRYLGTRMNDWMDDDVHAGLLTCWGHLGAVDTAAALRSTLTLYADLAVRSAETWQFNDFDHARVKAEVIAILALRWSLT